jgi:hypothetical protein
VDPVVENAAAVPVDMSTTWRPVTLSAKYAKLYALAMVGAVNVIWYS